MAVVFPATLTDHERRVAEAIAARYQPPGDGNALIVEVARIFDTTWAAIVSRDRTQRVTDARCVVVYLLRERGWRQTEIGALLRRDHTTINYMERRIEADHELRGMAKGLVAS